MKPEREQAIRLDQIKGLSAIKDLDNPCHESLGILYSLVSVRTDHKDYEETRDLCIKHGVKWTIGDIQYCAFQIALGTPTDDEKELFADDPELPGLIEYWKEDIAKMGDLSKNKGRMKKRNKQKKDRTKRMLEDQYDFTK